jgi:putative copper export protein
MLPITWDTVRIFIHVIAATVWVGGQLTLAALVPGLRAVAPDAPRVVARRFNQVAWTAYGVLIVTGLWNIAAVDPVWDSDYGHTLMIKIGLVAVSGLTALLHTLAKSRAGLAVWGAASGLSALAVIFFAVQLR